MLETLGSLIVDAFGVALAVAVTYYFVRRLRTGDWGLRSVGAWLRDLLDVLFGFG